MKVENLVSQNAWWKFGEEFWRYDRNLKEVKEKLIEFKRRNIELKKGNIYIVRGARQSGKTTYIKQRILKLLKEKENRNAILYLSCDRFASRKELKNTINNYIKNNRELDVLYLFLDEITYLKDWNILLKILADSNFIDKIVVVATGSNPVEIKQKAERLPGRRVEGNEYYFKPLTFREFLLQTAGKISKKSKSEELARTLKLLRKGIANTRISLDSPDKIKTVIPFKEELDYLLNIYLLTGGFPNIINDYLRNKMAEKNENIRSELYETLIRMILGDISKTGRSELTAREIMRKVAEKYTTRYSFTTLGRSVDAPHQTVIDYLEVLENSFVINVLYSVDLNKKNLKFKADKKIYFADPFIYHSVSSFISGSDGFLQSRENLMKNKEKLIEGVVANHMIQTREIPYTREWRTFLWYFYSPSGKELDFVYKGDRKFYGIEVKLGETIKKGVTKAAGIDKYVILTKDEYDVRNNVAFVPVSVFLSLLERSDKVM